MRAISFGRISVPSHLLSLRMGADTLSGPITAADEIIPITGGSAFSVDMLPFMLTIDAAGASEIVQVRAMTAFTFTVRRGEMGTIPISHGSGSSLLANSTFAGWDLSTVAGLTGKMYWGTRPLITSGLFNGIIYEFWPSGAPNVDSHNFSAGGPGNPLKLTDYAVGAAVDGEGLFVTLWER